jgi:hypothetical protein
MQSYCRKHGDRGAIDERWIDLRPDSGTANSHSNPTTSIRGYTGFAITSSNCA